MPTPQKRLHRSGSFPASGSTVARIPEILDQHTFTAGNARSDLTDFTSNDLFLLNFLT